MSRKTSPYARKRRHIAPGFNGAAWMDSVARCRPYTDDPIPGSWLESGTQDDADKSIAIVRQAFGSLKAGVTLPDDEDDFSRLAHALGLASIRAGQIAGEDPATNEMLSPIKAGNEALRRIRARRITWGKWELLAADVADLDWAIEVYETVVLASSPAQMSEAVTIRTQWIYKHGTAVQIPTKEMTA